MSVDSQNIVFVGGIKACFTSQEISDYFSRFGEVCFVKLKRNRAQKQMNRGFCLVKFKSRQAAEKVIDIKNHTIKDRLVTCRDYLKGDQLKEGKQSKDSKKIYINNLPSSTTNEDIVTAFSVFGQVEVGYTLKSEDGAKSKGFGFVTFADQQSANKALQSEVSVLIHGKKIEIAPFVSSESKKADASIFPLEDLERRDSQPTQSGSSSPLQNSSGSEYKSPQKLQQNWYNSNPMQLQNQYAQNMLFWNSQFGYIAMSNPQKNDISFCQPGIPATAWTTNYISNKNNFEPLNSSGISREGQQAQTFPIRTEQPLRNTANDTTGAVTPEVQPNHEIKPTSKLYFTYSRPALATQELIFRAQQAQKRCQICPVMTCISYIPRLSLRRYALDAISTTETPFLIATDQTESFLRISTTSIAMQRQRLEPKVG